MTRSVLVLPALALLAGCGAAPAQAPRALVLDGKLRGSYGQPSNVVEVAPGKVAFTDIKDRRFLLGDFVTGNAAAAGRHADTVTATSPPSDHKLPGWVAYVGNGQVALVDFAATRTTIWDGQGQPVRALAIPMVGGMTPVLAYDTVGHGYKVDFQPILGGGEPGQTVRPDSMAVLRIELASGKVDTVAHLSAPEYGDATVGEQTQTVAKVFSPNDIFGALPDGSIWVARGRGNTVDWRSTNGSWKRGTRREYTPVPVTQADKDRVMEQLKARGLPAEVAVAYPFAERKPPFEAALARPAAGEVWLQRSRGSVDQPAVYDIVERDGRVRYTVAAPKNVIVVGFGAGDAVYALERDDSGGRVVERYRLR